MLEWLEDEIEKDPMAAYPREALEHGIALKNTGDALFDKWERDLAAGKDVDFASDAELDQGVFDKWLKASPKAALPGDRKATAEELPDDGEFSDKYGET